MVELKVDHSTQSKLNILHYKMSNTTSNPNTGGMFGKFKFSTKTKTIMSPANFTTLPAKNKFMHSNNAIANTAIKNQNVKKTELETKIPSTIFNQDQIDKSRPVIEEKRITQSNNLPNVINLSEKSCDIKNDNNNNSDKKIEISDVKTTEMQQHTPKNSENIVSCNNKRKTIFLHDVHPHITCMICKGYFIDPCSVIECGHSFCHSCLMKHLQKENFCPQCQVVINKSKTNIKYDATMQAIVFKLVPGLYEKELKRKRAFYRSRPEEAKRCSPEQRGEDTEHLIFGPSDNISVSISYADAIDEDAKEDENMKKLLKTIYLCAPAIFRVEHLKKFIANKFMINTNIFSVEISYKVKTIVLPDHYTLMDVCYIYKLYPVRESPMAFFFRIIENKSRKNCKDLTNQSTITKLPTIEEEIKEEASSTTSTLHSENPCKTTENTKKTVTFCFDKDFADKNSDELLKMKSTEFNVKVVENTVKNKTENNTLTKTDPIKLKLSLKNLIGNSSMTKSEQKLKKKLEKLEKKIKNGNDLKEQEANKTNNSLKSNSNDNKITVEKVKKSIEDSGNNSKAIENLLNESEIKKEKDEYEFEDEIDQQKLGFLNTFELTVRKSVANKKSEVKETNEKGTPMVYIPKNQLVTPKTSNLPSSVNKRKSEKPVKTVQKKFKSNEMKTMSEGDKFLMKKLREGKEITFDLSPKPLGTKPAPTKITMEMIQAMNAEKTEKAIEKNFKQTEEKLQPVEKPKLSEKHQITNEKYTSPTQQSENPEKPKNLSLSPQIPPLKPITTLAAEKRVDAMPTPSNVKQQIPASPKHSLESFKYFNNSLKSETEFSKPSQISPVKPKKLPLLLPKKPEALSPMGSNRNPEISVTRINDGSGNRKVYGPKLNPNPNLPSSSDGFLFPVPQKPITTSPSPFPQKPIMKPNTPNFMHGFNMNNKPFKTPGQNPSTPFPRTPFYSPDSPIYTPGSYDSKPQFKYTNPLQYTSFLNNMINTLSKSQPQPPTTQTKSFNNNKTHIENSRKHKNMSPETTVAKRKTPDNIKNNNNDNKPEKDPSMPMSVLKNISFPPSLSVSFITNEQEQEQIRNLKQNIVNNNIEIIKLPDTDERKSSQVNSPPPLSTIQQSAKTSSESKDAKQNTPASPDIPLPPPVQAALSETKESFQKKFLESIISNANKSKTQNRIKKTVTETGDKRLSTSPTNLVKKSMPPPSLPSPSTSPSASTSMAMNNMNFPELAWMAMNNMNILNNPFTLQRQFLLEQLKKNVERQNLLEIHMKNANPTNPKK